MILRRSIIPTLRRSNLFFLRPATTSCIPIHHYQPHHQPITTPASPFSHRKMSSSSAPVSFPPPPKEPIFFGPFKVTTQVFLLTPHTFALVNLKPLLPGHVLVCPRMPHRRLVDMSPPELTDLWVTVQRVQKMLGKKYFGDAAEDLEAGGSFNVAIQDGAEAGQTVGHVHVHVIPRVKGKGGEGDGDNNDVGEGDKIYEDMAGEKGNVGGHQWDHLEKRPVPGGAFDRIEDAMRGARGMEEMEREAGEFRELLAGMKKEEEEEEGAAAAE